MTYKILNIIINSEYKLPLFKDFEFEGDSSHIEISLSKASLLKGGETKKAENKGLSIFTDGDNYIYRYNNAQLKIDKAYKKGSLFLYEIYDKSSEQTTVQYLYRTVIECKAAKCGFVSLHSACVEKDGFAVCFTGFSGLGKSTRANIWAANLSAEFLSGDRPGINTETGVAFGVPWDGKEGIYRNEQFPLKAVFDIRRGKTTTLRRLSPIQRERILSQQCFYPMWDTETAYGVAINIKRLSQSIPVYRLICDKTEAAAREAYNILFYNTDKILKEQCDMIIKKGFVMREVGKEHIIFPIDDNITKFNGTVVLNEVSAFVFEQLQTPLCFDDLLEAVINEFSVDKEVAKADLKELIKKLDEMGILEHQE